MWLDIGNRYCYNKKPIKNNIFRVLSNMPESNNFQLPRLTEGILQGGTNFFKDCRTL